jgi:tetratricopeptide (TPR) repeat protein
LYRTIVLAQVNLALGDRAEAERLAREVLEWKEPSYPGPLQYAQVVAHALLGQHQAALDALERLGVQRLKGWWYAVNREPAFNLLRSDPRFQAFASKARAHAAEQRTLLEQMRERGEAPRRAVNTGMKSAPC